MPPPAPVHPAESDLAAFALGKLDAAAAETVQQHLDTCEGCRAIAEHAPPDSLVKLLLQGRPVVSSPHAATPSLRVSETRGGRTPAPPVNSADLPPELRDHPRYRIIRELGRGGMGVVYQAQHKLMDRLVAVKVVNRALVGDAEAAARFAREVKAAAQLHHPNIVAAHDAEQAGELQILAMEYVEGLSLAQVLDRKGPLPVAHACYFIRQAALGLQHAHEKGMVHRDIKPSNLMLTAKGGVVKILDFGLAKLVSERARIGGLTSENVVMGTPEYLAPEQAMNTKTADIRADIYALGCTLFCLLTGRPPFPFTDGDQVMAIFLKHLNDPPPDLQSLRPEVPAELAALVARMLAKDPAGRPQTPREVAAALAPFAKPSAAVPITPTRMETLPATSPPRPAPRRWWLIPTGVALAAALVVTGLWAGGVFTTKVTTTEGTIVLIASEEGSDILVDREKVTVTRPGGGPVEIRVVPGRHTLEVKKDGFRVETRELTLDPGGRQELTVRLEPVTAAVVLPSGDGFVPMFNGKDLTGWRTHPSQPGNWHVDNGALVGRGASVSHLYSERGDYENVHVRAEVSINAGGNSGLYIRAADGPKFPAGNPAYPLGYEAQIYFSDGPGPKTGSLYAGPGQPVVSGSASAALPNQWFTLEVIAIDDQVTIKVNGLDVTAYTDPNRRFTRGHVALQAYPNTVVAFRKIEVKELASAKTATPATPTRRLNRWIALEPKDGELISFHDWRAKDPDLTGGVLRMNHESLDFPHHQGSDVVLRAQVRLPKPGGGMNFSLRGGPNGHYLAGLGRGTINGQPGLWFAIGKGVGQHADYRFTDIPGAAEYNNESFEDFVDVSFAAVGDRLTLTVDGRKMVEVRDSTHTRGSVGFNLWQKHAELKDIEVKILRE